MVRVDEEDENRIAGQEQQEEPRPTEEEERRRRVELGRPRVPELIGSGMTHLSMEDDEEPPRRSSPRSYSVVDQHFERLTALSAQLESTVEPLQAYSTISSLESKVTALESLVQAQSQLSFPISTTPPHEPTPPPSQPDSLTTSGKGLLKGNGHLSTRNGFP
jgi:hypothetical protein